MFYLSCTHIKSPNHRIYYFKGKLKRKRTVKATELTWGGCRQNALFTPNKISLRFVSVVVNSYPGKKVCIKMSTHMQNICVINAKTGYCPGWNKGGTAQGQNTIQLVLCNPSLKRKESQKLTIPWDPFRWKCVFSAANNVSTLTQINSARPLHLFQY